MLKGGSFKVQKALNNNVVIVESIKGKEIIFIGKGIGFGKKIGDSFEAKTFDKVYSLIDEQEQENYLRLVKKESEETLLIIHEAIEKIHDAIGYKLHESIHFNLTQHLALALQRTRESITIENPFLIETKWLYHDTYKIAEKVVKFIYTNTFIKLPETEVGFITLHIQSGIKKSHTSINNRTDLLIRCVRYIEEKIEVPFDKNSIVFQRFVHHLKEVISNPMEVQGSDFDKKFILSLKSEHPLCYNLAQNLARMIKKSIGISIGHLETIYLMLYIRTLMEQ